MLSKLIRKYTQITEKVKKTIYFIRKALNYTYIDTEEQSIIQQYEST